MSSSSVIKYYITDFEVVENVNMSSYLLYRKKYSRPKICKIAKDNFLHEDMLRHCMGSGGEILQSMKKGAGAAGGHSLSGQNMPPGGARMVQHGKNKEKS